MLLASRRCSRSSATNAVRLTSTNQNNYTSIVLCGGSQFIQQFNVTAIRPLNVASLTYCHRSQRDLLWYRAASLGILRVVRSGIVAFVCSSLPIDTYFVYLIVFELCFKLICISVRPLACLTRTMMTAITLEYIILHDLSIGRPFCFVDLIQLL